MVIIGRLRPLRALSLCVENANNRLNMTSTVMSVLGGISVAGALGMCNFRCLVSDRFRVFFGMGTRGGVLTSRACKVVRGND